MSGRSANLGDCTQPCRWQYEKNERVFETSIVDDKKRYRIDLEEDQHGTYFLNSYDMNLLAYVDKLVAAGVSSLKIEGRAKSVYYVSVVSRVYRKAIDAVGNKVAFKKAVAEGQKELKNLVHRGYSTGFLLGAEPPHNIHADTFQSEYKFVGQVEGVEKKLNVVYVHNEIFSKDKLEAVTPEKIIAVKIKKIFNHKMEEVKEAHGGHAKRYFFEFDKLLPEMALIRKKA
jgi:putative protease